MIEWAFQVMLVVKSSPAKAGDIRDTSLIPVSGNHVEKDMETHSSSLTWRIPWTERSLEGYCS